MIAINIRYYGKDGAARAFVEEMTSKGIVNTIREEEGNLRYEYYLPFDDKEYVLLVDAWKDQEALDKHHSLPVMQIIIKLREKYGLHMEVEKYLSIESEDRDKKYIRE